MNTLRAQRPAVLAGRVLVESTKEPIAGAEVALPDLSRSASTDAQGVFRVGDLPVGSHRVVVRRVGYALLDTTLTLAAGETVDRVFVLSRRTLLDSLVVKAEAVDRRMVDFEENRKSGRGHFLTRADLAFYEGRDMTAALAGVPGLGIVHGTGSQGWAMSRRSSVSLGKQNVWCPEDSEKRTSAQCGCYAQVYLDGVLMNRARLGLKFPGTPPFDLNSVNPEQVEAVEWYAGPSQTPPKYSNLNSTCGVLAIWTRRTMG